MFTRFLRNTLFSKIVVTAVSIGFLLASAPVSYANTDALKTRAAKKRAASNIAEDLGNKVNPQEIDPLVLSNIITLLEGKQTGGVNIVDAILAGANGGLFNHSERRRRLEIAMENMLSAIIKDVIELGGVTSWVPDKIKNRWESTLRTELSDKEIEQTSKWLDEFYFSGDFREGKDTERIARRLVNYIMNIQLKKIIAYSDKYPIQQTILCVGETKEQFDAGRTEEILRQDIEEILAGISKEQARKIVLRIAYEARWVIGKDEIPEEVLTKIDGIVAFIKGISKEVLGEELEVDYGASVNEHNAATIFSLPHVDGVLIGGAAKTPEEMSPIIDEAINIFEKTGKRPNIGMNWKAENESTGLSPLNAFKELFRTKDLSKAQIVICTGNVKLVRDEMTKLENEISAVALYSGIVVKTETVGPFIKETLAARSEKTEALYAELEKRFGEGTREGDVYFRLKLGNRYFALAKENIHDQTLMTAATLDLTDLKTKTEYYAALLEYSYWVVTQTGKGLELIEEKGDRLKQYLSSASDPHSTLNPGITTEVFASGIGSIFGMKYWFGLDKFFQMEYTPASAERGARATLVTFKKTDRPLARGWSLIVQPKITVLVNGYGTVGSKAAQAARNSGFAVVVADIDSSGPRIKDAVEKGYTIYVPDATKTDAFKKAGIPFAGTLEKVLARGKIDVVIDATPGGIGAANLEKIYKRYPNVKVVLEGGEKAKVVEASFSSSTNYNAAKGKKVMRVVSCNTTGMARIYGALLNSFRLTIDNTAMRRGADPGETKGPNPDSISFIPTYHHGEDLLTVLTEELKANLIGLNTPAGEVPMTHYHLHMGTIRGPGVSVDEVKEILKAQSRVGLIEFPKGEFKTPILFDIFNTLIPDANHPYIISVQVLPSSIEGELKIVYAVPQESNVVPENVNVLQAMFGLYEKDAAIRLVDEVLGIDKIKPSLEARLPTKIVKAPKAGTKVATIQSLDIKVNNALPKGFDNVVDSLKGLTDSRGAVVVGAHTIFENGGTIATLRKIKEAKTGFKVAVWADNQATVDSLMVMGVEEAADIISYQGLDYALRELNKLGIANEQIIPINSALDLERIKQEFKLEDTDVFFSQMAFKATNLKAPNAEQGNLNSMPLVIARAIAAIFQNEESVVKPYQELVQNYKESGQISGKDLAVLDNLTAQISTMPLVQLKFTEEKEREALQAQIVYEETMGEI